jgi:midasin
MKSVMNITELKLSSSFNFYHDSIPQEARLIFSPLDRLQKRVRDILMEYESPILNDVLFLSNYMMTSFNTKSTPLMKILTGVELLLEKLDEWQPYASKNLNSCHEEITSIKQLIIRYRKIQILSWRNLLNHRRIKMIKDDFRNCIRLIHTVER